MPEKIRVGIIDFDLQVRSGRRLLVESQPDFELVFEGSGSAEELDLVANALIDVLVIEQRLGHWSGLEFANNLRHSTIDLKSLPALILTCPFESRELLISAIKLGMAGVIPLDKGPGSFIEGIRTASFGESLIKPAELAQLISDQDMSVQVDLELDQAISKLSETKKASLAVLIRYWKKRQSDSDFELNRNRHSSLLKALGCIRLEEVILRLSLSGKFSDAKN